jgi:outer membrane protein assembly factor BamE (lipoprotein component of BamABCDE complex)
MKTNLEIISRAALAVAASSILLLTACSRLTEDNLQKVHNGMTTAEVKAILGDPTSSDTGSALGIVSGTTYVYHTSTSDVKITFVNDKVIATEGEFK